MFQHIGKKIQEVARNLFLLHITLSCILGAALLSSFDEASNGITVWIIGGMALSIFLGWLSVLLFYAFGKIEEHCEMQCDLLKILVEKTVTPEKEEEEKICPNCGAGLSENANFCSSCGTRYTES